MRSTAGWLLKLVPVLTLGACLSGQVCCSCLRAATDMRPLHAGITGERCTILCARVTVYA